MLLPQDFLDTGKTSGGRTAPARREVLRLLGEHLPDLIEEVNAREGLQMPVIKEYRFAKEVLSGTFPAVLSDATTTEIAPVAIAGVVKRVPQIAVYVVAGKAESADNIDDLFDIAELAELILKKFKKGHNLPAPDGRRVWNSLDAKGIAALPAKWSEYAGKTVTFSMDQAGCDLWTLPGESQGQEEEEAP